MIRVTRKLTGESVAGDGTLVMSAITGSRAPPWVCRRDDNVSTCKLNLTIQEGPFHQALCGKFGDLRRELFVYMFTVTELPWCLRVIKQKGVAVNNSATFMKLNYDFLSYRKYRGLQFRAN